MRFPPSGNKVHALYIWYYGGSPIAAGLTQEGAGLRIYRFEISWYDPTRIMYCRHVDGGDSYKSSTDLPFKQEAACMYGFAGLNSFLLLMSLSLHLHAGGP